MDLEPDPFEIPIIFLRTGWMDLYAGKTEGDEIFRGGSFVEKHGYGYEMFNFHPFEGSFYGYAQPPGGKGNQAKINIEKLGASKSAKSVSGVLAIWVATSESGGARIVGWYENATVYRDCQPAPSNSGRNYGGEDFGYYVTARVEDSVLVPSHQRQFSIPNKGKGALGRYIWYANVREQHRQLRLDALKYVKTCRPANVSQAEFSSPRQFDPTVRLRVERTAVDTTIEYFQASGYRVDSVEKDNVGWDLNAVRGDQTLKLEVKGLSGSQTVVELTSNEFAAMQAHRSTYNVCVVTDTLVDPRLEVFTYSDEMQWWGSSRGRVLRVQERIAARCYAE